MIQSYPSMFKMVKHARLISRLLQHPQYGCHLIPVVSCLPIISCVQLCPGVPTEKEIFLPPLLVALTKHEDRCWETQGKLREQGRELCLCRLPHSWTLHAHVERLPDWISSIQLQTKDRVGITVSFTMTVYFSCGSLVLGFCFIAAST